MKGRGGGVDLRHPITALFDLVYYYCILVYFYQSGCVLQWYTACSSANFGAHCDGRRMSTVIRC